MIIISTTWDSFRFVSYSNSLALVHSWLLMFGSVGKPLCTNLAVLMDRVHIVEVANQESPILLAV